MAKRKRTNNDLQNITHKTTGSVYDKWNISVVICDTDNGQPSHGGDRKSFEVMNST